MAKVEIPIQVNIPVEVDKLIEFLKKDGTLVEVVRCRECKYFGEYCDEYKEETQTDGMCELDIKGSTTFDWFCADGERKEGR